MKEVDCLALEIADLLNIHEDDVNLSQVPGGWLADVERIKSDVLDDPFKAMQNLLDKVRNSRSN